jgi:hypothetical protein
MRGAKATGCVDRYWRRRRKLAEGKINWYNKRGHVIAITPVTRIPLATGLENYTFLMRRVIVAAVHSNLRPTDYEFTGGF